MRVLALDVSLTCSGWASRLDCYGTIEPGRLRGAERLAHLADWTAENGRRAHLAAIEQYAFSSRTAHAHALGEAGGVVRLELHRAGVPFVEVAPALVKLYAAGKGNASKEAVLVSAVRRLGYEGENNNEADALWLLALVLDAVGEPIVTVPAQHRKAVASIRLPKNVRRA